jgi:hypothetical protein
MSTAANMIDRLSARVAIGLAVGGVLLVVLLGWFVLVHPKRAQASDLAAKTADAEIQLADTQQFLHSPSARKSVGELKKLTRAIPGEPQMPEILRQLSQAARAAGVRIDGITPTAVVASSVGGVLPITVTAEGHYFRLQKFVHLLGSAVVLGGNSVTAHGRLLAIDSVQFSNSNGAAGASGKNGAVTATLAVDAFVSGIAPANAPGGSNTSGGSTSGTSTAPPTSP